MAIVYQHIRRDTGDVFYVGIGKSAKRAYNKIHRNGRWLNIVNKTNYEVEIVYDNLTWDLACSMEKRLIEAYGRNDLGLGTLVNMTEGGEGSFGAIRSTETRRKLRNHMKGRICVYKESKSKYILPSELETFINNGWKRNIIY